MKSNLALLVDVKHLQDPKDLLCEESGSWKCKGCCNVWVVVSYFGVADICEKNKPSTVDGSLYI